MTKSFKKAEIMQAILDDAMHEAKVFIELSDLPLTDEHMLKLSIVGYNFTTLFERFEKMRLDRHA